jgi:murein DD-endopeptidase MepM/ murein hydrolase activator NlpD
MRLTALTLIGILATAGCTNYRPLPHTGGSWEEARRALYGQGAPASAATRAAPEASVTPEPAPTTRSAPQPTTGPPTTTRDGPVRDAPAARSLEPKPLPPLRTTSSDAPVPAATSEPAPEPPASTAAAPSPPPDRDGRSPAAAAAAPAETATTAGEERVAAVSRAAEPPVADADASLPPPALSGVGFLWPVPAAGDTVRVTDVGDEGALAIEAPADEPFVAAENGVVVFAGDDLEAYGRMVVVRHDGDYTTAYGHASRLDVAVGDIVRRGQRLGLIGTTGEVTTPQLHFEMRVGSRVVDPRAYLVEAPRLVAAR